MPREFPRIDFENSSQGWAAVQKVLIDELKDERYPMWIMEKARDHYVDSIRKHELDDMRHMAHERPELAAQERGYASRDREQLEIVETILGYLRALSAEGFARDIKGYFAAQKRPDVPTTGKEIKAVRQRKS
jgi:hypothetical protein